MDWQQFITDLKLTDNDRQFEFYKPIAQPLFENILTQFKLNELPTELITLYKQSDGIGENRNGKNIGELIWTAQKVIDTNIEFRTSSDFKELYMSFEQLLFFSDAGNGDMFAFITLNGNFERNDIFVWNHEVDSRTWVAPDLAKFIQWRLDGKI